MGEKHGKQIKDDDKYEALREKGYSKQKSARIANTPSSEQDKSKMGQAYESWTKEELYDKAKDVGIEGRSKMSKADLARALKR